MQHGLLKTAFAKDSKVPKVIALCLMLIVLTLAVYMQTANYTFFILDKNDHVTDNPYIATGLTGKNILWAFTSVAAFNWHPVTWLSHMAIAQFYGMDPTAHHLANVMVHTVSSVLLLFLFCRITGSLWQSSCVAALFALHPLHVESVAWVAERKDVLSAFFWFLTLLLYSEYVAKRKPALYMLTLVSFALGLMSKSMLVTLPPVMLLMDFWPLGRYWQAGQKRGQGLHHIILLTKEKIPFFACSFATGLLTIYAQYRGGATKSFTEVPFSLRIENAAVAYVKYIAKTLCPVDLGVLYPMPSSLPLWQVIGSLLILLLISAFVIRFGRTFPYLPVGWFWFIITLLPVIGLIQVGSQSMADRYTYIPVIGLFIMAAWAGADLTNGLLHRKIIATVLAGVAITVSTALAWCQVGYWQDSISILRHTLQITTNNYLVHDLLGMTYAEKGDLDAAFQEYRKAVQINPEDAKIRSNLGIILSAQGNVDGAIREFQAALRLKPDDVRIHTLLGDARAETGDLDAAIREYQEALRISPSDITSQRNLGDVLERKRRRD